MLERESYVEMVLSSDIALVSDPNTNDIDDAIEDFFVQPRVLAVSQDELVLSLGTVPSSTVEGLWTKAEWRLKMPNQVVVAPGCWRQRGRVIRAQDLKSVGRGFKSRSDL